MQITPFDTSAMLVLRDEVLDGQSLAHDFPLPDNLEYFFTRAQER